MALKKNQLLEALDQLRDSLRQEVLTETNHEPVICTDDALKEMVRKTPLKLSDFLAISGLEKNFIDSYGQKFLNVISHFRQKSTKEVKVSRSAHKVLHHYKDRLTNISRTNPNLYTGRIEKVKHFDLASLDINENIINFLTQNRIKTLKLPVQKDGFEQHMTTLYREVNKSFKETGSYNLYIGYPYIEGMFRRERFPIKAPLLYFPVTLERTKRTFTLKKDDDKDIVFNRDLLLVTSKMENNTIDEKMPPLSGFNEQVLKEVVLPFYAANGVEVADKLSTQIIAFETELKEDFIKRKHEGFVFKPYVTLGRYTLYSSMIQKDMDQILSSHKYNELLEGLIDEKNLYDQEKKTVYQVQIDPVVEQEITYINDLNDAQEKVIELINREKKMVVWGPPGTGKSQTITSLIASSVLRGENVLVVSEKKVALDVIYSRLKRASKYAMFIDDASNKQDFYFKLKTFLDPTPPTRTRNNDIYALEVSIKEMVNVLDRSLDLLYNESLSDIPIHKLYERYLKDKSLDEKLTPRRIYNMFVETFNNPSFKDIMRLEKTFQKDAELNQYLSHHFTRRKFSLLDRLETKVGRSANVELQNFNQDLAAWDFLYQKSSFFKRRRLKKRFLKENEQRLIFLTKRSSLDKRYLKLLFKDRRLHEYVTNNLLKLDKLSTKYDKLSKLDRRYLDMLLDHPLLHQVLDVYKSRQYLFDGFYTGFLENFRAKNQAHLYMVDEYAKRMLELNVLIDEKMHVSSESFEMVLYQSALNFSNTKRIMDIKRILEAPYKPSIKAFIDIFQPEFMQNIKIWMMTPEVVSAIMPLVYGMFDLVIFDEASQMYVEKGIPSIYRAKKVVIAGDPKQLRPSSLGIGRIQDEDDLFEEETLKDVSLDAKSLLDLARYKYKETLLNYHYRSTYEELIAFSNHAFYDGKLIVSPNQKHSPKPPIEYVYVKDATFIDKKNKEEAKAVVDLIKKIFRQRKNRESIGVITFNSSQRDLIENYIDQELFKTGPYQKRFEKEMFRREDGEDLSLFVKNIENVQGDERDIIIFSMGYAKNQTGQVMRRFGWLNHEGGQNRLNVAVTRAKRKIYFVSSLYPEEFKVDDLTSLGPKLLKDFMRYCYFVSTKNSVLAKELLNQLHQTEGQTKDAITSHLAHEVKTRLERAGYQVETAIGIGQYHINLAVYDKQSKSYSLGIICDIKDPRQMQARRDLLHQERYLKARNWTVYRVFASNWYTNPNKEMRNMRDLLKK